ncbi:hypothetical protein KIL84_012593 [Mauremys mutica]|uniref:Uncharacterized protein n=1 Tax=Mauremys mutica TaxID=74926 RepID=A0A9D3XRQ5_9SAUR|nr:hypothetical protein KIL84_012593 [Mauremys mutica]
MKFETDNDFQALNEIDGLSRNVILKRITGILAKDFYLLWVLLQVETNLKAEKSSPSFFSGSSNFDQIYAYSLLVEGKNIQAKTGTLEDTTVSLSFCTLIFRHVKYL